MNKIGKTAQSLRDDGLTDTLKMIIWTLIGLKIRNYRLYRKIKNKRGIEVGGPSSFFIKEVPIYKNVKTLDGANFSSSTIWEGNLQEGKYYNYFENKKGHQYISDATDLNKIESGKYDFLLSCNNLEHIANPFKALTEWLRVIKKGGILFLVLPNNRNNFDHNRSIITLDHLMEDFENKVTEADLTHLDEILALHDLSLDPLAGDFENFKNRSMNNFENRCLHQHVFDMTLLEQIFKHFNIQLITKASVKEHYVIVGKK